MNNACPKPRRFDYLPQVCRRCRQLKMSEKGRFFFTPGRYNARHWICFECLGRRRGRSMPRSQAPADGGPHCAPFLP